MVFSLCKREALCILSLATLELVIQLVCLLDDLHGVLLVLVLVIKAKLVLWFAVRRLVVSEPNTDFLQLPGELPTQPNMTIRWLSISSNCLLFVCIMSKAALGRKL